MNTARVQELCRWAEALPVDGDGRCVVTEVDVDRFVSCFDKDAWNRALPGVIASAEFRRFARYFLCVSGGVFGEAISGPFAMLCNLKDVAGTARAGRTSTQIEGDHQRLRAQYAKEIEAHDLLRRAAKNLGLDPEHFTGPDNPVVDPPIIAYEMPEDFERRRKAKMATSMLRLSEQRLADVRTSGPKSLGSWAARRLLGGTGLEPSLLASEPLLSSPWADLSSLLSRVGIEISSTSFKSAVSPSK